MATRRGLAAGVIRGGVRDAEEIEALEFCLAATHVTPRTGQGADRYVERGPVLR
jgi:regulator of RNase E activity RraA